MKLKNFMRASLMGIVMAGYGCSDKPAEEQIDCSFPNGIVFERAYTCRLAYHAGLCFDLRKHPSCKPYRLEAVDEEHDNSFDYIMLYPAYAAEGYELLFRPKTNEDLFKKVDEYYAGYDAREAGRKRQEELAKQKKLEGLLESFVEPSK